VPTWYPQVLSKSSRPASHIPCGYRKFGTPHLLARASVTRTLARTRPSSHRTEPAEVFSHGVFVPGRYRGRIGAANLAGMFLVEIAAQLQLERRDAGQQTLMQLVDHHGVAGEAPQIEMLHRGDELLDLTLDFGIVRRLLPQLIQLLHTLLDHLLPMAPRR